MNNKVYVISYENYCEDSVSSGVCYIFADKEEAIKMLKDIKLNMQEDYENVSDLITQEGVIADFGNGYLQYILEEMDIIQKGDV